ncbi:MAG: hypothetical protein ACLQVN_01330 [Bryobacteraceae bacterium]
MTKNIRRRLRTPEAVEFELRRISALPRAAFVTHRSGHVKKVNGKRKTSTAQYPVFGGKSKICHDEVI